MRVLFGTFKLVFHINLHPMLRCNGNIRHDRSVCNAVPGDEIALNSCLFTISLIHFSFSLSVHRKPMCSTTKRRLLA